jgi:hypothetical protein
MNVIQLALQRRRIAAERSERRHHRIHLSNEHSIGAAQRTNELSYLLLCNHKAIGAHVRRLHRGTGVDQHDDRASGKKAVGGAGVAQSEHEQRQKQKLQQ